MTAPLCYRCNEVEPKAGGWCEECLTTYREDPTGVWAEYKTRPKDRVGGWENPTTTESKAEAAVTIEAGTVFTEPGPFVETIFRGETRGHAKWMRRSQGDDGGIDDCVSWLRPSRASQVFDDRFGKDDYVSIATYNTTQTGADKHLDRMSAVVVDLDFHKAPNPMTPDEAIQAVLTVGEGIPTPSIVSFTGEGLAALWLLERSDSRRPPKMVAGRHELLAIFGNLADAIRTRLGEAEPRLNPDPSSSGLRLTRLPGSVNTGSGETVWAVVPGVGRIRTYTIDAIERSVGLMPGGWTKGSDPKPSPCLSKDAEKAGQSRNREARIVMLQGRLDWLLRLYDHRREHGWPSGVDSATVEDSSRDRQARSAMDWWLVFYVRHAIALHHQDVKRHVAKVVSDLGIIFSESEIDRLIGREGARYGRHVTSARIGKALRVTADEALAVGPGQGFFPHAVPRWSRPQKKRMRLKAVVLTVWESEGPMSVRKMTGRVNEILVGGSAGRRAVHETMRDLGLSV